MKNRKFNLNSEEKDKYEKYDYLDLKIELNLCEVEM